MPTMLLLSTTESEKNIKLEKAYFKLIFFSFSFMAALLQSTLMKVLMTFLFLNLEQVTPLNLEFEHFLGLMKTLEIMFMFIALFLFVILPKEIARPLRVLLEERSEKLSALMFLCLIQ